MIWTAHLDAERVSHQISPGGLRFTAGASNAALHAVRRRRVLGDLYQFNLHMPHVMLSEAKHLGSLLLRPFATLRVTACGGAMSNWYNTSYAVVEVEEAKLPRKHLLAATAVALPPLSPRAKGFLESLQLSKPPCRRVVA